MTTPCKGTRRAGKQCERPAAGASGFCDLHDPAAASARGKRGRAKQLAAERERRAGRLAAVALETVDEIRELVREAVRLVGESSEPDTTRANALLRAASVAVDMLRTTDLEREIAELRALVEELSRNTEAELSRPLTGEGESGAVQ